VKLLFKECELDHHLFFRCSTALPVSGNFCRSCADHWWRIIRGLKAKDNIILFDRLIRMSPAVVMAGV
jgi:hypothetical protein